MIYKYLKEIKVSGKTQPVFYLIFYNSILKELDRDCILYEDRHMIIHFMSARVEVGKHNNFDYNLPEIHITRKEIPHKLIFNLHLNVTVISENITFCCTKYDKKINKYLNRLKMVAELKK